MIDSMFRDVTINFKPLVDATEINTSTTSKLVQMQAAFMTDMLTFGLANTKAITEMRDPKEIFESQQNFARDLGQKCADAAQQQFATLNEAKEEIQKMAQDNFSGMQVEAEKTAPVAKKARAKRAASTAKA